MRTLLFGAIVCLVSFAAVEGWRPLFDGKSLDGWTASGGKPAFTVEDGEIRARGNGVLEYSREKIGNTTLRVIYRVSQASGDAGVRIGPLEVEIGDRESGALRNVTKALCYAAKPAGEWNTMDITLDGPRIVVKLNSALVADYREASAGPGTIAIRHGDDASLLSIREISVR